MIGNNLQLEAFRFVLGGNNVTVPLPFAPAVIVSPAVPLSVSRSRLVARVSERLLVTVSVTGPGNESVRLQGYRTRYAPRSP